MAFEFRTVPEIFFGAGESRNAPEHVARLGRRALIVTGARSLEHSGVLGAMIEALGRLGVEVARCSVPREPDVELVDAGAEHCCEAKCDVVLAIGGGSVLDAGKAIAALATNGGSSLDYLEEVGTGRTISQRPLPVVAVPTTAGSGSEVTRNSVLRVPQVGAKRSLRSDLLLPRVAIIDPALAAGAPRTVAAAAGLDALTHLIEAYVSRGAQPMTDTLALAGIRLALRGLRALSGSDSEDRRGEDMALASLWGGISLANAGLGAVHGLAAPIGGRCSIAHGVVCACLLPAVWTVNTEALQRRAPDSRALARYTEVGTIVEGDGADHKSVIETTAPGLDRLRRQLGVPPLRDVPRIFEEQSAVIEGSRGGSMKSNPIALTDEELQRILTLALQSEA